LGDVARCESGQDWRRLDRENAISYTRGANRKSRYDGSVSMQPLSTPAPDADLLLSINGLSDPRPWLKSRWPSVHQVIIPLLRQAGIVVETRRSILDFGCGCGRILAGWEHSLNGATLRGVDINPAAVNFCRENIGFAEVGLASAYPPLPFDDRTFDLIYAASVWTHLTLPQAVQWAGEMARLLEPGGALMISFHGPHYENLVASYSAAALHQLQTRGYYVHRHDGAAARPDGSNYCATFMRHDFIVSMFKGFELLATFPGPTHFGAHQDIVIFRRYDD
jgi:SAM-dependent methyltransferase